MPKSEGLTNISLSSDSEHDQFALPYQQADGPSETTPVNTSKTVINGDATSNISLNGEATCEISLGNGPEEENGGLVDEALDQLDQSQPDDEEEAEKLIDQILTLQKTLDDLSTRMENVKEDNLVLKSENQVLSQYIENVMQASSAFQQMSPKSRKRSRTGRR